MAEKKLLLVVDMQNDFITGSLGTPEAQAIVPKVVEKIKNWDGLVWFTMDTHEDNYLNTPEGRKLPVKHCIHGTDGWRLHPEVQVLKEELRNENRAAVWMKNTFGLWELPMLLRIYALWDVVCIEVIGLCTDICVISNAMVLKSSNPFREIAVDASCCAGTEPELHEAALEIMQNCQIDILNWEISL